MDITSNDTYSISTCWDVFLSFYGKDTRRNFISNLYFALDQAGVLTFRDDHALEKGEEISSGLVNAIKNSKMFVVVISENYARSPWCLNELVQILSCKRIKNQIVPVFYYVNPSDLRYLNGSFGEALQSQKGGHSVDTIDKWKSALAEIAEFSGYHLKNDTNVYVPLFVFVLRSLLYFLIITSATRGVFN